MRFTRQKELRQAYIEGKTHIVQKFLWFPLTIDGETRWLEEAKYVSKVDYEDGVFFGRHYYWKSWQFLNK